MIHVENDPVVIDIHPRQTVAQAIQHRSRAFISRQAAQRIEQLSGKQHRVAAYAPMKRRSGGMTGQPSGKDVRKVVRNLWHVPKENENAVGVSRKRHDARPQTGCEALRSVEGLHDFHPGLWHKRQLFAEAVIRPGNEDYPRHRRGQRRGDGEADQRCAMKLRQPLVAAKTSA